MKIIETSLHGSYIIEPHKLEDNRGYFSRIFDKIEFLSVGNPFQILQSSISINKKKGTLRGMHYQHEPYHERKIVHCVKGSIYDVILDIRPHSKTYKKWFSIELDDKDNKLLYIPNGFAHGFQTLKDNTAVIYYMDQFYHPECSKTISYMSCNIQWKITPPILISKKDIDAPIYE